MAKILIVDDAEFLRVRLNKILDTEGYEVLQAENGNRAVTVYKESQPDVVLMDVTMPEMDGLAALKEIVGFDPKARVIMLTALGQESVVLEAVKSGARDFIVKPFEHERVMKAISKLLAQNMTTGVPTQAGQKSGDAVKVLIVDDSAFMRFSISQQLNEHPEIVVVGTANHGKAALQMIPGLQPDVITLDVEMPQMDGLTTLRHIMVEFPRPVIMFSSLTKEGAAETIQALMLGAVDFIPKPQNRADIREVMKDMTEKILCAARAKVKRFTPRRSLAPVSRGVARPDKVVSPYQQKTPVVLIGASTGGPGALSEIIPSLPADFPAPILIVQHMPAGFTHSLSERLDSLSSLSVKEAEEGDPLMVGRVLLAPGGYHMTVAEGEYIALNQRSAVHGVRPSVDVTLLSLIQRFGRNVIAVILTGMGSDGTHGASLLHSDGGYVIAEHESTCVVWGMPRSVTEAGAANIVLPRPQIASTLDKEVRRKIGVEPLRQR